MTTLDLANPAHVEALRLACAYVERSPGEPVLFVQAFALSAEVCHEGVDIADLHAAHETLADPARAADLVRARLEQVGVREPFVLDVGGPFASVRATLDGLLVEVHHWPCLGQFWQRHVPMVRIPRLVLALLDATSAEKVIEVVNMVNK